MKREKRIYEVECFCFQHYNNAIAPKYWSQTLEVSSKSECSEFNMYHVYCVLWTEWWFICGRLLRKLTCCCASSSMTLVIFFKLFLIVFLGLLMGSSNKDLRSVYYIEIYYLFYLQDVATLTSFFKSSYGINPEEKHVSVSGHNWGEVDFNGKLVSLFFYLLLHSLISRCI